MKKIISLVLSFSIIFMSVAPSYAQVAEERERTDAFAAMFDRAVAAEAQAHGKKVAQYEAEMSNEIISKVAPSEEDIKEEIDRQRRYSKNVINFMHAQDLSKSDLHSKFLSNCAQDAT
ncbi:MAG: hypothetical protein IKL48_03960, partial [Elusimicrobiaceae bacterium]|nr:hypothetical protein [Elusimicrobiaceae bacterium]